jgi:hypothetical protein
MLPSTATLLELGGIALAVGLLALAVRRPTRTAALGALGVCLAVGLTVAQPFGMTSERLSKARFYEPGMTRVDATAEHSSSLAGVLPLHFRLEREGIASVNGEGGDPTHQLVARSHLLPGVLVHSTEVTELCGPLGSPCWDPRGRLPTPDVLQMWRTPDGDWRLRVLADVDQPGAPPPFPIHRFYGWQIEPGIASPLGLIYWLVAIPAAIFLALRPGAVTRWFRTQTVRVSLQSWACPIGLRANRAVERVLERPVRKPSD